MHHQPRIHGDKIDLGHIAVQADQRLVNEAATVGANELRYCFERFGLLLEVRHQHATAQRGLHLHRGHPGAGRFAGDLLHGQAGDARLFQHARQAIFGEHHGVALVDMPTAVEMGLAAAVDDLPVGEIAVFIRAASTLRSWSRLGLK